MKMIDYIKKVDFFIALYQSDLFYPKELNKDDEERLWDNFVARMQYATERLHLYDALWSIMSDVWVMNKKNDININNFNDCVYYLLGNLPEHPIFHCGLFKEIWNIKNEKVEQYNSLEDRVKQLEISVEDLKHQIMPNYGGRM